MNQKSVEERAKILQLLTEGNSMRSTARITDCAYNTVANYFVHAGQAAEELHQQRMIDLPCRRVQLDEIWSFVHSRKEHRNFNTPEYAGDLWTWTAICPDTKLLVAWHVGDRTKDSAIAFVKKLSPCFNQRVHFISDGFHVYRDAIEQVFGIDMDFSMLVKKYKPPRRGKYEEFDGATKQSIYGSPDLSKTTTAHVERHNLTMRSSIKRMARKTTAHSKKKECHGYAVALHAMYYNFCRINQSIRVTPAMAAGISDHIWEIEDIVKLI